MRSAIWRTNISRSTFSRRARNSDSVKIGARRRPASRPSRRRLRFASSRVEPDSLSEPSRVRLRLRLRADAASADSVDSSSEASAVPSSNSEPSAPLTDFARFLFLPPRRLRLRFRLLPPVRSSTDYEVSFEVDSELSADSETAAFFAGAFLV